MNSTAALQETIKARALEALRADTLPTEKWAFQNRVSGTVCKINMDLLNEGMAKKAETPRLTKADHEQIRRAIIKELNNPSVGAPLR